MKRNFGFSAPPEVRTADQAFRVIIVVILLAAASFTLLLIHMVGHG